MGNLGFYQISVQGLVKILPGEGNYTFCCNYTRAVVSVIKGQKMAQNNEKYVFFHFFEILIFCVVGRVKGKKRPKMTRNSVCRALYLRNHTSYDLHSLYTCEKG